MSENTGIASRDEYFRHELERLAEKISRHERSLSYKDEVIAERSDAVMHAHRIAAEHKNTADYYARVIQALRNRIKGYDWRLHDGIKQRELLKDEVDELARICRHYREELSLFRADSLDGEGMLQREREKKRVANHQALDRIHQKGATWTWRGGTEVRISEMSDAHLTDTIRMLHRSGKTRQSVYGQLLAEKRRRKELRSGDYTY